MDKLTHFNQAGLAHMVNVGGKAETLRIAKAAGKITMLPETFQVLQQGNSKKGDVLGIARIAAISGTKQTANIIPLCHPLSLSHVAVDFTFDAPHHTLNIIVTTETLGRTGVEMEALSGVMSGLLTVYDMLKAIDKTMRIYDVLLLEKQGGKSGHFVASE